MNSENRKTSNPFRLLLNLTDKIDLKRSDIYYVIKMTYTMSYTKIYNKSHTKTINLKYQL